MANDIDRRVVEMQFENRDFEKNANQSIETLDKLQKGLEFSEGTKGLENIDKASKKVNFEGMSNALTYVGQKFTALEIIGITALQNITNKAINAGEALLKSLTIDQVKSGFNEYELKMGSVQTIMAGTGESLETVMDYLEELNRYSDQTIYSFSDMTTNIGKFTNAGVKLDQAVAAIKGVSNAAALSGANAGEASRAMYNFAQALSAGYVKLIDWKSIENANMATQGFKQELIDTAVELGTLKKVGDNLYSTGKKEINATKNFNDSLQDQWMTTDVLIKTLERYADSNTEVGKKATAAATEVKTFSMLMDTMKEAVGSGWGQSFEIIIGDFEEAKSLFTDISNFFGEIIEDSANRRNALLEGAMGEASEHTNEYMRHLYQMGEELKNEDKITSLSLEHQLLLNKTNDKFKTGLMETAVDMGTLTRLANGYYKTTDGYLVSLSNLNLESGWLSGQILNETLEKTPDNLRYLTQSLTAFEDSFKDVAKKHRLHLEDWMEEDGSFLKTLKRGWLSDDIVDEVIKAAEATNDLSDEQKAQLEVLKRMREESKKTGESFGDMYERMHRRSGRELLIDSFWNIVKALEKLFGAIKDGFRKVFPKATADQLYNIIEAIEKFTSGLIMSDDVADRVSRTFGGLFAIFDMLWQVIKFTVEVIGTFISAFLPVGDGFLTVTANIGDFLVMVDDAIKKSGFFEAALEGVKTAAEWLKTSLQLLIDVLKKVPDATKTVIEKLKEGAKRAKDWADHSERLQKIWGGVKKVFLTIGGAFVWLWKKFMEIPLVKKIVDKLVETFKNFGQSAGGWFSGLGEHFMTFIGHLKELDGFSFENIKKAFKYFYEDVLKYFPSIGEMFAPLGEGFKSIGGFIVDAIKNAIKGTPLETVWNALVGMKDTIVGFVKNLFGGENSSAGSEIGDAVSQIGGPIKNNFDDLGEMFTMIGGGLLTGLQYIYNVLKDNLGAIGLIISGIAVIKLTTFMAKIADFMLVLSDAVNNFSVGIKKLFKAEAFNLRMEGFKKLAQSILMLVAALVILSFIPQDELLKGLIVVGAVAAGMVVLTVVLDKVLTESALKKMGGFAAGVTSFAFSMLVLTASLKWLGITPIDRLIKGLIAMGILIGYVIGLMVATNLVGKKAIAGAGAILMISAALLLLTGIITLLGLMPIGMAIKGIVLLSVVMGLIVAMFIATKTAGMQAVAGGVALIAISFALYLLVGVIAILGAMNPMMAMQGILLLVPLMGVLYLMFIATSNAGPQAIIAGAALVLIGAALYEIAGVIAILSLIAPGDIVKSELAIAGITGMFGGIIAFTKFAGSNAAKAGVLLMLMSGAMLVLAGVIWILAKIEGTAIAKAVIAIDAIGIMLASLLLATGIANEGATKIIIALTACVAAIGIMIAILASIGDPDGILKITMGISAVIAAMVVLLTKLETIQKMSIKDMLKTALKLAILIGAIGGVLEAITLIPGNPDALIPLATAMSEVMLAVVPLLAALNKFGNFKDAGWDEIAKLVVEVAGIIGTTGIILAALAKFTGTDTAGLKPLADAMSEVMLAVTPLVTAILLVCSYVKDIDLGVVTKAAAATDIIIGFIAGIMLLLGGIGDLINYLGGPGTLERWMENVKLIGGMIGGFVGGIVGGFLEGVTDHLDAVADNLNSFMDKISIFLEKASVFGDKDNAVRKGVGVIAEAVVIMTAASFLNGIASFFGGGGQSLPSFGLNLSAFAIAFLPFMMLVGSIGKDQSEAIKNVSISVLALAQTASSLPWDWKNKAEALKGFIEELAPAGDALEMLTKAFAKHDIDFDMMTKFGNAIKSLAEATKGVDNEKSVLGAIIGGNDDLDKWQKDLGKMANIFKSIGVKGRPYYMGDVEQSAIENFANITKTLSDATKGVDNVESLWGFIAGGNDDLNRWAANVETMARLFCNMSNPDCEYYIGNLTTEPFSTIATIITDMSTATKGIDNVGSLWGFFAGGNEDIVQWGLDIIALTLALLRARDALNGKVVTESGQFRFNPLSEDDGKRFETLANIVSTMATATSGIDNVQSVLQFWITGGGSDPEKFGESISGLAKGLMSAKQELFKGGILDSGVTTAFSLMSYIVTSLNATTKKFAENAGFQYDDEWAGSVQTLIGSMASIANEYADQDWSGLEKATTATQNIANQVKPIETLGDAITPDRAAAIGRLPNIAKSFVAFADNFKDVEIDMTKAGSTLVALKDMNIVLKELASKDLNGLDAVAKFFNDVNGASADTILSFAEAVKNGAGPAIEAAKNFSEQFVLTIGESLPNYYTYVEWPVRILIQHVADIITEETSNLSTLEGVGYKWMSAISMGISSDAERKLVEQKAQTTVDGIVGVFTGEETAKQKFRSAGIGLINAIHSGLSTRTKDFLTGKLAEMVTGMVSTIEETVQVSDLSTIAGFFDTISNMSLSGVEAFVQNLSSMDSIHTLTSNVNLFARTFMLTLKVKLQEYEGIITGESGTIATFIAHIGDAVTAGESSLMESGKSIASKIGIGMSAKTLGLEDTATNEIVDPLINNVFSSQKTLDRFYQVGVDAMVRVQNGIFSRNDEIKDAAVGIVEDALGALNTSVQGQNVTDVANFFNNLENMSANGLSVLLKAVQDFPTDAAKDIEIAMHQVTYKLSSALTDKQSDDSIIAAANSVSLEFCNGILAYIRAGTVAEQGRNLGYSAAGGVSGASQRMRDAAATLARAGINKFNEYYPDAHNSGEMFVKGFCDGMRSYINGPVNKVYNTAVDIGNSAVRGIKDSTKEASPSKVAYAVGRFFDMGFINGMDSLADRVGISAMNVGDAAVESIAYCLDGVDQAMNRAGDNYTPMLSPIIDLDNARMGINGFNGMVNDANAMMASAAMDATIEANSTELKELVAIGRSVLTAIKEGGDVYLDENILVGRINRRLGMA